MNALPASHAVSRPATSSAVPDPAALPASPSQPVPTPPFSLPVRVYYEDTDAGGVVYYANYLRFFERCRTEWLRAAGYDQGRLMQESGLLFVVRAATVDYLKPARLDDELVVELGVAELGRAQVHFNQWVRRAADGAVLASGVVRVVCADARTLRPRPIPDELLARLASLAPAAARPRPRAAAPLS